MNFYNLSTHLTSLFQIYVNSWQFSFLVFKGGRPTAVSFINPLSVCNTGPPFSLPRHWWLFSHNFICLWLFFSDPFATLALELFCFTGILGLSTSFSHLKISEGSVYPMQDKVKSQGIQGPRNTQVIDLKWPFQILSTSARSPTLPYLPAPGAFLPVLY